MGPENRPETPIYLPGGAEGQRTGAIPGNTRQWARTRFVQGPVHVHPDNPADADLARFLQDVLNQDVLNHRMLTPAEVIERYGLPADRAEPK